MENNLMNNMFYYTPELTDLRIGYECQNLCPINNEWKDSIILEKHHLLNWHFGLEKGMIRTPYLTKQDIEDEGWEFKYKIGEFSLVFKKNEIFNLEFIPARKEIRIKLVEDMLFRGTCNSINELRTIQKLLEIK